MKRELFSIKLLPISTTSKFFHYNVYFYTQNGVIAETEASIVFFLEEKSGLFFSGNKIIGESELSEIEIITFLAQHFKGLRGANTLELLSKNRGFFSEINMLAHYDNHQGFSSNARNQWMNVNSNKDGIRLIEIVLVSAQKGNGFYHEEDFFDLKLWQPKNLEDFDLLLCFELYYSDGTKNSMFTTWSTSINRIYESLLRYKTENNLRIFQSFSFHITNKYDLKYWDAFFEDILFYFVVEKKEEALIKYNYFGFDIPNIRQLTQTVIGDSDTYYEFDGNIEFE